MKKYIVEDSDIDNVVNTLFIKDKSNKKIVTENKKYTYEQMLSENVMPLKENRGRQNNTQAVPVQTVPVVQTTPAPQVYGPPLAAAGPAVQYGPPVAASGPAVQYGPPPAAAGPAVQYGPPVAAAGPAQPVQRQRGRRYRPQPQTQEAPSQEAQPQDAAKPTFSERLNTSYQNTKNSVVGRYTTPTKSGENTVNKLNMGAIGKDAGIAAAVVGGGAILSALVKKLRSKSGDPQILKMEALKQCDKIKNPDERQECINRVTSIQ